MLLLAGCGRAQEAVPKLAHGDAARLAALAGRIATEGSCAQRRDIRTLHRRAIALVNARRVPAALEEPFLSGFAALAAETPVCVPGAPARALPKGQPYAKPTSVEPVPHATRVEREARNLERWLDAYAG
jgi:hypothetical protein